MGTLRQPKMKMEIGKPNRPPANIAACYNPMNQKQTETLTKHIRVCMKQVIDIRANNVKSANFHPSLMPPTYPSLLSSQHQTKEASKTKV